MYNGPECEEAYKCSNINTFQFDKRQNCFLGMPAGSGKPCTKPKKANACLRKVQQNFESLGRVGCLSKKRNSIQASASITGWEHYTGWGGGKSKYNTVCQFHHLKFVVMLVLRMNMRMLHNCPCNDICVSL